MELGDVGAGAPQDAGADRLGVALAFGGRHELHEDLVDGLAERVFLGPGAGGVEGAVVHAHRADRFDDDVADQRAENAFL